MRYFFLAALFVPACFTVNETKPAAPMDQASRQTEQTALPKRQNLQTVYHAGLKADMREGLRLLNEIDPNALSEKNQAQYQCIKQRFEQRKHAVTDASDPFVHGLIETYRRYWLQVMLGEQSIEQGKASLEQDLRKLLSIHQILQDPNTPFANFSQIIGDALEARGYHSIRGITKPLYELTIWKTQRPTFYPVQLPEEEIRVEVVFLEDFVSLGWAAFATCDSYYSSGWAEKDKLFVVTQAYEIESEDFRVSYLTHEGQHFADYKRFPKLDSVELEYRAKLAELSQAQETAHALLEGFASNTATDRRYAHPMANHFVSTHMREALGTDTWKDIPVPTINEAAKRLLIKNTADLQTLGPDVKIYFSASKQ